MLRRLVAMLRARKDTNERLRVELDDEIGAHLEMRTRDLIAAGWTPAEARREAERRFGHLPTARARLYASARRSEERVRLSHWLDSLRQDLLVAMRRLRASPGFTALSVLTFALGIGLTTTMFAVVDVAVLRPLPFPEPDRLVALWSVAEDGNAFPWVSSTNWLDWKEQNRSLAYTGLYQTGPVSVAASDETARVPSAAVGGSFFEALGMPLLAGRTFSETEANERAPVAVVSESFWRRFLGADPALGDVLVQGTGWRVVGVVPDRAAFPDRTQIWLPAQYRRMSGAARNNINWQALARLAPGVDPEAARTDLDRVAAGIREIAPEAAYSWGVGVVPLTEVVSGDSRGALLLLVGAVLAVLLVACANLAGQAYARSLDQVESAGVRLALGATRWRVLQHQLLEHLLLASLGGIAGLAATWLAGRWLATMRLPLPRAEAIAVDLRVLAFAVLVSMAAGLLAGLLPAWRVSRAAPKQALGAARGATGGASPRAASLLVAAEITLSVLLLIGGGLMIRSFGAFLDRDLGFSPDGVFVADLELSGPTYEGAEARASFWDRLLQDVRGMPGVESAALAREVPGTDRSGYGVLELEDRPELEQPAANYRVVSERYFETLRLPLLAGRDFDDSDTASSERVAVVNRAFVETFFPSRNPLGLRFRSLSMELDPQPTRIVGVVGDLDTGSGRETRPATYVLYRQVPLWSSVMYVTARVRGDEPLAIANGFRERLRALDAGLASELGTVNGHLSSVVARDRLVMRLLNGFALVTLLLAAIGVHGLLSFSVVRRTREIAVRAALGADRRKIVTLVMAGALQMATAAAACGALAAWWLSGFLDTQVVGIRTSDPVTFAVVIGTLLAVTAMAAGAPAWRAARLDPSRTLRAD